MGKQRHSKDRLFITQTEWRKQYGGKDKDPLKEKTALLPFDCCALSFAPFKTPVCSPDGVVFDLENIAACLKTQKINPVTRSPLRARDLIRLHFARNKSGALHCPITFKEFANHSHIVAIRTTGNVFSYDAVKQLNLDPKQYTDLLDDTPFQGSKDVIHLQDPSKPEDPRRLITRLHRSSKPVGEPKAAVRLSDTARRVLEKSAEQTSELSSDVMRRTASAGGGGETGNRSGGGLFSSGAMSRSFTSTAYDPETRNKLAEMTQADKQAERWERVKALRKKAYVRLTTSHGNLNVEIDADLVPQTAENFLGLCKSGKYDGVIFHRLIRNFMIQGGDPTGTGHGGESIWGGKFRDKFHNRLTHSERGILSMANSGPDSNGSQFYITFKSCHHLNRKHSVFGRVVGGADTLDAMEKVLTDDEDRPRDEIKIISTTVFSNPFDELSAESSPAAAPGPAAGGGSAQSKRSADSDKASAKRQKR